MGTNDIVKCFELLGLGPEASMEEVKQAYRDLVKVWHPDRFTHDPKLQAKAQEKLKEINEAYIKIQEFLINLQSFQQAAGSKKESYKNVDNSEDDNSKQSSQSREEWNSYSQNAQPGVNTENANIDRLYEAILGQKNREYYLSKFKDFDQRGPGLKASWNWPAFFCCGGWSLYRKMYGWFFVLWGITILASIIDKAGSPVMGVLVWFIPWVVFPIFANSLYHNKVKERIASAQTIIKDESMLLIHLQRKGGVHFWPVLVLISVFIIGIIAALIVPIISNHRKQATVDLAAKHEVIKDVNATTKTEESNIWKHYGFDADGEHFYRFDDSSKDFPGITTVKTNLVYSESGKENYIEKRKNNNMSVESFDQLKSRTVLYGFNCVSEKAELVVLEVFELSREGKSLDYAKAGSHKNWTRIPPGSVYAELHKIVCANK